MTKVKDSRDIIFRSQSADQNLIVIPYSTPLWTNSRFMGSTLSYLFGNAAAASVDGPSIGNHPGVTAFHSTNRWMLHFNSVKDSSQLMVIDFAATWCGPCKFMEPVISAMASKYTDVQFAKIDVDELPDVAQEFRVQAMPTFVLVKGGKEVDRVVGADKNDLERKLQKHTAN